LPWSPAGFALQQRRRQPRPPLDAAKMVSAGVKHALSFLCPRSNRIHPGLGTTPPPLLIKANRVLGFSWRDRGYFTGDIRNPASNASSSRSDEWTHMFLLSSAGQRHEHQHKRPSAHIFIHLRPGSGVPAGGRANCPSTPNTIACCWRKAVPQFCRCRQPEFTLTVVSDPTGCNTNSNYNMVVDPTTHQPVQLVSVYRRRAWRPICLSLTRLALTSS